MGFGLHALARGERAFRKPVQSWEETEVLGPAWAVRLMHTQSSKCTGWQRQGYWSDGREATGMSLCPSRSLFCYVLSSLLTTDSTRSRELEGLGKYRVCIFRKELVGAGETGKLTGTTHPVHGQ